MVSRQPLHANTARSLALREEMRAASSDPEMWWNFSREVYAYLRDEDFGFRDFRGQAVSLTMPGQEPPLHVGEDIPAEALGYDMLQRRIDVPPRGHWPPLIRL